MKKRMFCFIITTLIICSFATLTFADSLRTNDYILSARNKIVFSEESLIKTNLEAQPFVPEAFHVENGVIYIHDRINQEIIISNNTDKKTIKPDNCEGVIDLVVIDEK